MHTLCPMHTCLSSSTSHTVAAATPNTSRSCVASASCVSSPGLTAMVTNMSLFPPGRTKIHKGSCLSRKSAVCSSKLAPGGGDVGGPDPSKELEGSSGMLYLGASDPISHASFKQRPNGQTMSPMSNMIERY